MQYTVIVLLACAITPLPAQQVVDGPKSEKGLKAYKEASEYVKRDMLESALDKFKKADKEEAGHCSACQNQMIKYGIEIRDWKTAELAATELVADAQGERNLALAHYQFGVVLMREAQDKHKEELFSRSHDQFTQALAAVANFPDAVFADGRALAFLKQDDAAKAQFEKFVKMKPPDNPERQRALRYISQPD